MESSTKINSISIDLTNIAEEIDAAKCNHFSIRGFAAEIRERDPKKCWPFSDNLGEKQSYFLPPLSVPKSRWWNCASCIKDINFKEINQADRELHIDSTSIKEKKLDSSSAATGKKDQKADDHERNEKDKQTGTLVKKTRGRPKDNVSSTVRSKTRKFISPERVSKKSKDQKVNNSSEFSSREAVNGETMEAATTLGSSEIAGLIEDTPKTIKNHNPDCMTGPHHRKSRKIRLLSDLLGKANMKNTGRNTKEETFLKRESVRGRKRKLPEDEEAWRSPPYVSRKLSTVDENPENVSRSYESKDNSESQQSVKSQSSESGFDKDTVKGKQKNKRFQIVDECLPEVPPSKCNPSLVPYPLHNQSTEKRLSRVKKRNKKAITDNKKSAMITFSNLVNVRKPEFSEPKPVNSMPQSGQDLQNVKWFNNGPVFSNGYFRLPTSQLSLPLQEMHRKGDDHAGMKELEKNQFQDFGSSSKSKADESLRTGVNVDFSRNGTTSRLSFPNDKIRHFSYTEVADGSCIQKKDISTLHSKGKAVMVEELYEASKGQSNDRTEKIPELIDDIPMEIVELMAKNQYERCLPDKEEDKQPLQATTSISKNALLIDLNETYENSNSVLEDNTLKQPKLQGKNVKKSDTSKEEHYMTGKQFFSTSQFGQPYVPSRFGIFPFTQDNQSSSIQFSGVGCNQQSNYNVPPMASQNPSSSSFRVLRACDTCQSVPQQFREVSHSIWPSSMTSHGQKPVSFNIPQKFVDQPTKLDTLAKPSSYDPSTWNLNFVDKGKQQQGFDESSIPAMQLLSLMDPRLRSNIPIDHSAKTNFLETPFSSAHQSSKGFVGFQQGEQKKQWPFDFYGKRLTPETSRGNVSVIPPVGTSSFSFQSEKSSAEKSDFRFQDSWNHQGKETNRKEDTFAPVYNNHEQSILPRSNDPRKFQLLGASDSMMRPLRFHMTNNAKKNKTKKPQSYNTTSALPPKSTSGSIECSFNRNPADFTIPEPGNVYMIKCEDLKVRKQTGFKKSPSLCKQDALKQNKKSIVPTPENT